MARIDDAGYPTWCPDCKPDANTVDDPTAVMVFCKDHKPSFEGDMDNDVSFDMQYPGLVTGGRESRDMCDLLHKDRNGRSTE